MHRLFEVRVCVWKCYGGTRLLSNLSLVERKLVRGQRTSQLEVEINLSAKTNFEWLKV
jgi:hypothetical protein